ncbi:response regulator [Gloeobacter kilaueensis]|uniref:Response regulator receiver protein n=1 Tax=Gloeobacter kilaueensis (strain ATCC BAA-2537 / CCAP 1431/1 / ULC 316 / JS1) TaxID=1183438 RepID=U5QGC0_GLOK1|nr:response regulator [Gloeobacter kilaueensis]AGY56684.1 response regulator receiver protein [Gloeobacter kilaueensis JS1]
MVQPRVLIVEDNPEDALLARRVLKKVGLGANVLVLEDAERAVAYLRGDGVYADRTAHPLPVLTLLDLRLPGQNGHELLAWMRGEPDLMHLQVAMLTSADDPAAIERSRLLEAACHLLKPIKVEALRQLAAEVGIRQ